MAIDDSTDEHLGRGDAAGQITLHEVDADRFDRRVDEHRKSVIKRSIGRRHEDAGADHRTPEQVVCALRRRQDDRTINLDALAHQCRLIQLHPFRTDSGERSEQLRVDGEKVVETVERLVAVRSALGGFAEKQERHRADDHGTRAEAAGGGFGDLANEAIRCEVQLRLGADLGHQVVIVAVEPLRHLGRGVCALTAGDGEVSGEIDGAVLLDEAFESRRNRPDRDRGVEHLVVVGKCLGDG